MLLLKISFLILFDCSPFGVHTGVVGWCPNEFLDVRIAPHTTKSSATLPRIGLDALPTGIIGLHHFLQHSPEGGYSKPASVPIPSGFSQQCSTQNELFNCSSRAQKKKNKQANKRTDKQTNAQKLGGPKVVALIAGTGQVGSMLIAN